jgi:hypothetical protein
VEQRGILQNAYRNEREDTASRRPEEKVEGVQRSSYKIFVNKNVGLGC